MTRPFKLACCLFWRDGSQLTSQQHVGSQQRIFPSQEGHNRTRIGKWRRGGADDGNVLEFDAGVVNRWDNVDGLILVIVIIIVNQCKGRVRRRLALVKVSCKRPETLHESLQMSVLAGADFLDP